MFFLSRAFRSKHRQIVNKWRQSTRRLLLESLEDRLVPTLIPNGWLIVSNAGGKSAPPGLYAINPNGPANQAPIPISAPGAFDESVGLAEDSSSGVLYSLDYGAARSDNFSIKVPTGTMLDHALMKVDPISGITSVLSYDNPGTPGQPQENLYGSDAVVFLPGSNGSNDNLYVISQGDGGGNLHLLVNVEDNSYPYDPPTHSVVQIDPNGGSQTPVYNDSYNGFTHSDPPPRTDPSDAAYPTGSNFINGYLDRTKSLDDEEDPSQSNSTPDLTYGYDSLIQNGPQKGFTNDPSSEGPNIGGSSESSVWRS